MATNYERIIRDLLERLYRERHDDLEGHLPAERRGNRFFLKAFGKPCVISPDLISLAGVPASGPEGLLVALYAIHSRADPIRLVPFKAFKDLPNSMPYHGAFAANTERVLVPYVASIKKYQHHITKVFDGTEGLPEQGGDFSFVLYPLPKVALSFIFYLQDEEFPASATCLFSCNALSFMPLDGLADVGEYTAKAIILLLPRQ